MTKTLVKEPELFAPAKEAPKPKPPAKRKVEAKPASTAVAVHKPQPPAPPKSLLQVIAEAASNPAVDVQKMKELLAIQKDMEATEAEREFTEALALAQSEMPRLARDAKSDKHKYLRLETVTKQLDPIIARHRFTLSFGMADSALDGHYRITAMLARGSHQRHYFIDLPADTSGSQGKANKTPVQGIGSTISYARRYLTLMIFNVAVTNEDDDGAGGEVKGLVTEKQVDEIVSLCADKGIDLPTFQKAFRVPSVESLPAVRFEDVKARLKSAPKAEQKKASNAEED